MGQAPATGGDESRLTGGQPSRFTLSARTHSKLIFDILPRWEEVAIKKLKRCSFKSVLCCSAAHTELFLASGENQEFCA